MNALSEQLHSIRTQKHLTQQEMAVRLGWAQGRISAIETGRLDPRVSSVVQMGRLLEHEIMLVPKALLPAIQAMITGKTDEPLWNVSETEESA